MGLPGSVGVQGEGEMQMVYPRAPGSDSGLLSYLAG